MQQCIVRLKFFRGQRRGIDGAEGDQRAVGPLLDISFYIVENDGRPGLP